MTKREKLTVANSYFAAPKEHIQFVSTGCTVLDCALGGGFALGRVANIVGDKSTAKTGIATEVLINFMRQYPDGEPQYRDAEAAFDSQYAHAMGLKLGLVNFGHKEFHTVEDFARDVAEFTQKQTKANKPGLYILDSLDALSDQAEMETDIGKGTYGMAKPKQLSTFFRKFTPAIEQSKVLLLIISQVRDNINAMAFGEKQKRSGGKALDFYASQIVWFAHLKTLKRTINKVERAYGIEIRAKVKKNKVSLPFREADFQFHFGYGVDDMGASLNWLKEVNRLDAVDLNPTDLKEYLKELDGMGDAEYRKEWKMVAEAVKRSWCEIDETFVPKRRKYA